MDELERLEGEQKELLDFQAELDEAQELLDSGKMTEAEFEERRATLREHAPDAVKAHARGIDFDDGPQSTPAQDIAAEIDLDDKLSGMALPTPAAPGMGQ